MGRKVGVNVSLDIEQLAEMDRAAKRAGQTRSEWLREAAERRTYRIAAAGRVMDVTFQPRADARHLPVALASMTSKYIRELFMCLLNRFWAAHVPNLKPTAGYPQDARRFLADIHPCRVRLGVPDEHLVRSR